MKKLSLILIALFLCSSQGVIAQLRKSELKKELEMSGTSDVNSSKLFSVHKKWKKEVLKLKSTYENHFFKDCDEYSYCLLYKAETKENYPMYMVTTGTKDSITFSVVADTALTGETPNFNTFVPLSQITYYLREDTSLLAVDAVGDFYGEIGKDKIKKFKEDYKKYTKQYKSEFKKLSSQGLSDEEVEYQMKRMLMEDEFIVQSFYKSKLFGLVKNAKLTKTYLIAMR